MKLIFNIINNQCIYSDVMLDWLDSSPRDWMNDWSYAPLTIWINSVVSTRKSNYFINIVNIFYIDTVKRFPTSILSEHNTCMFSLQCLWLFLLIATRAKKNKWEYWLEPLPSQWQCSNSHFSVNLAALNNVIAYVSLLSKQTIGINLR